MDQITDRIQPVSHPVVLACASPVRAGPRAAAGQAARVISAGTRNHFALDLGLDRGRRLRDGQAGQGALPGGDALAGSTPAVPARALRVVVPTERPGVPAPKAALEWPRLRHLASFRAQPDGVPVPAQPDREPSRR